jgi:hypothetical protein
VGSAFEKYEIAAPTSVDSAVDGADSVALDAAVNTLIATEGRTTAYVSVVLSDNAATVAVAVVLYDQNRALLGLAPSGVQTATASSYKADSDNVDYYAPILSFDLCGASYFEVRSADASAGTRSITAWAV